MIYNWYKIFNEAEFNELDLVSKTYTLNLEDLGEKEVLVTKGNALGITFDGVFLSLGLHSENPFEFEDLAIYQKTNGDVYLGFLNEG